MEHTGQQGGAHPGPHPPPAQGFGPPPPAYAPPPPPGYAPGPPPAYASGPVPQQQYHHPPQHQHQQQGPGPFADGPDFLATDRRNAVVVDVEGVSFERNGQTADFSWNHITTVPFKGSYSGTTLMVSVVLTDGRVYECTVDARNNATLQAWFGGLSHVLGFYLAGRGQ
ncbi:hypothetical protein OG709_23205 [Streptomyces sp. NBC_01267]|uniref:hypothetical protein n=1 Tax=Streptomyces sp. NBC_01267 TaxID=2903805 RepID=UPI002E342544|nr:hypothetical protein [Streptomyces sp. NBC_01267]